MQAFKILFLKSPISVLAVFPFYSSSLFSPFSLFLFPLKQSWSRTLWASAWLWVDSILYLQIWSRGPEGDVPCAKSQSSQHMVDPGQDSRSGSLQRSQQASWFCVLSIQDLVYIVQSLSLFSQFKGVCNECSPLQRIQEVDEGRGGRGGLRTCGAPHDSCHSCPGQSGSTGPKDGAGDACRSIKTKLQLIPTQTCSICSLLFLSQLKEAPSFQVKTLEVLLDPSLYLTHHIQSFSKSTHKISGQNLTTSHHVLCSPPAQATTVSHLQEPYVGSQASIFPPHNLTPTQKTF